MLIYANISIPMRENMAFLLKSPFVCDIIYFGVYRAEFPDKSHFVKMGITMYKELVLKLTQGNQWVKIQPPCSENDIDKAEKAVGYPFPDELRALLREMNGDNFLLLSVEEMVRQAKLNRKVQEEYSDEDFAKDLNKLLFFAGNGCGDYYCYRADADGEIDENAVYIWEHEESCCKQVASSMTELITRYYHNEI